ncbi:MAG: Crp/Fnr family transcriptional regulator [Polyangia bacterium]|jgi:CRP-like cAMP-binding protein|nr:Crp/Fnr family transcriptional regulator [Polyangia bacterium]
MRSYLPTMSYLDQEGPDPSPSFRAILSKLSIFRNTAPEAQRDIAARLVMRKRQAGSQIMAQDEPSDSLFIIQRGRVRQVIHGDNGRQMSLGVLGPGDFFGEMSAFDGQARGVAVEAIEDTTVLVLGREQLFEHLQKFPATAVTFLVEMSRRMRKQNELIANLALRDVGVRLARKLLDLAREDGGEEEGCPVIRRRPTQQELADMVGSCRETVSRAMTGFARKGLVRVSGRSLTLSAELLSLAA